MVVDIYCNDKKCPICEREVEEKVGARMSSMICLSGCYKIWLLATRVEVSVFGYALVFQYDDKVKMQMVVDKINYWKENDRYLAEILEGN